jgi:hypothetical protein
MSQKRETTSGRQVVSGTDPDVASEAAVDPQGAVQGVLRDRYVEPNLVAHPDVEPQEIVVQEALSI